MINYSRTGKAKCFGLNLHCWDGEQIIYASLPLAYGCKQWWECAWKSLPACSSMYVNAEKSVCVGGGNECLFKTFWLVGNFFKLPNSFFVSLKSNHKACLQRGLPPPPVNLSYLKVKMWQSKLMKRQRAQGAHYGKEGHMEQQKWNDT